MRCGSAIAAPGAAPLPEVVEVVGIEPTSPLVPL